MIIYSSVSKKHTNNVIPELVSETSTLEILKLREQSDVQHDVFARIWCKIVYKSEICSLKNMLFQHMTSL